MARAFAQIAFTPNVQSAQTRMGSRTAYRSAELGAPEVVELGPYETAFIESRDSFYQGTVGENGWPYVQHRGGPAGFLKVLGPRLIGYADFSGNRQYISVGNLEGDDRVSLFLMDYAGQNRLKIWGRARLIDEDAEPELFARLESPSYRAPVERGVVISVEAFDWNCPKHITPRFTEPEVKAMFSAWQQNAASATMPDEMAETWQWQVAACGYRHSPIDATRSGLRAAGAGWRRLAALRRRGASRRAGSLAQRIAGDAAIFADRRSSSARPLRDRRATRRGRARRVGSHPCHLADRDTTGSGAAGQSVSAARRCTPRRAHRRRDRHHADQGHGACAQGTG